jgi:uncharacterized protein YkwD
MKRFVAVPLFLLLFFFGSVPAYAADREELLARVQELKRLVLELAQELQDKIFTEHKHVRFERNLSIGSRGMDVERLQMFLARHTQFYPEGLVTGFYGTLTSRAVERLKNEYQIVEDSFGPKTREKLHHLFQERSTFAVFTPEFASLMQGVGAPSEVVGSRIAEEVQPAELALRVHDAVNAVRREMGLSTLRWNGGLANVALSHSHDQARDNVALTDPKLLCQFPVIRHEGFLSGFTVRDRAVNAGIRFRAVGENIAMIPGIQSRSYLFNFGDAVPICPERNVPDIVFVGDEQKYRAALENLLQAARNVRAVTFVREVRHKPEDIVNLAIDGWMNSQGHRDNMLYGGYTESGVGVVKVNEYYIITQNFLEL